MTQTNGSDNRSTNFLRHIIRIMAQHHTVQNTAPHLLDAACTLTRAQAGFYLIFNEPHYFAGLGLEATQQPPVDELRAFVAALEDDIYMGADLPAALADFDGWLVMPIPYREERVALVALLFSGGQGPDESIIDDLYSLIDSFCVLTRGALTEDRHRRVMRNQNEFVRIVSHDLRSPLTSIQGFASMLESSMVGDLNEKQTQFISKILSGITQMTSLVDNIQDAGRYDPQTGFYEIQRSPTDLGEIVNKIVKNHLVPAEKQELTLTKHVDPDLPILNIDPTMFERALINLVDNAIKYTPNGGTVDVSVQRQGEEIVIGVHDNGYGISEDNQKKLFTRHFRVHRKEHKRVKGSGLGLFIVRSVAQHHGGHAWIESREGEGSHFYIRIPLSAPNLVGVDGAAASGNE